MKDEIQKRVQLLILFKALHAEMTVFGFLHVLPHTIIVLDKNDNIFDRFSMCDICLFIY